MSQKKKMKIIWIVSILAIIFVAVALFADNILNAVINKTMGKELPQLVGEPEVGEWYAIDIDEAVSSDGSKWQGYFRKGSENKVVLYFYGGGFGAAILADDAIALFNNPQDVAVLVDSSLLITEDWHDIMVNEWHSPQQFSDVVTTDNITLDSLVALHNKRANVKILFDCSVRDYNLAMAQRFFDEGAQQEMPLEIGKAEGDRFQQILKKMAADMQEKIPGCGIYIWDKEAQANGHLTVHTAAGTKIFFDSKSRNPSLAQWLANAVNGNVESFGLELLDRNF